MCGVFLWRTLSGRQFELCLYVEVTQHLSFRHYTVVLELMECRQCCDSMASVDSWPWRSALRRAMGLVAYDRAVPMRLSSLIRIEGMTLKRLLLVVLEDFAEAGDEA